MQVGFEMVDAFAESQGISMNSVHCKAIFGQGLFRVIPFPHYVVLCYVMLLDGLMDVCCVT